MAAQSYYRHLVALFKVTSDLDHKSLGRELLTELFRFEKVPGCHQFTAELERSLQLRRGFRELVMNHRKESMGKPRPGVVSQFRMSKRGRKPTLSKRTSAGFLEQVLALGQWELPRSA
ncbi:MAG: hypothetical protein NTV34_18625 [Proteobacteria bacterium]|nr:hypothetical protein [Pseudomonadota bacterium]